MQLRNPGAEVFVPDGLGDDEALARTTHMGIAAHPDDLEILAYHGILQGFGRADTWFFGVTVTDGSGSPRGLKRSSSMSAGSSWATRGLRLANAISSLV